MRFFRQTMLAALISTPLACRATTTGSTTAAEPAPESSLDALASSATAQTMCGLPDASQVKGKVCLSLDAGGAGVISVSNSDGTVRLAVQATAPSKSYPGFTSYFATGTLPGAASSLKLALIVGKPSSAVTKAHLLYLGSNDGGATLAWVPWPGTRASQIFELSGASEGVSVTAQGPSSVPTLVSGPKVCGSPVQGTTLCLLGDPHGPQQLSFTNEHGSVELAVNLRAPSAAYLGYTSYVATNAAALAPLLKDKFWSTASCAKLGLVVSQGTKLQAHLLFEGIDASRGWQPWPGTVLSAAFPLTSDIP